MQHPPGSEVLIRGRLPNLAGKRVLDVGCGQGGIGYMLRQCPGGLDAHLTGIELYEPYLDFVRRFHVYDDLIAGDVTDTSVDLALARFDVVLACEILEHIPRPAADRLLDRIEELAIDMVIVSTPNGPDLRPPIDGVDSEAHVSVWRVSDFRNRGYEVRGIGSRIHRSARQNRLTMVAWHSLTPIAIKFPLIAGTIVAVKLMDHRTTTPASAQAGFSILAPGDHQGIVTGERCSAVHDHDAP
ncbi:MAG: class I SAM-dependent methyltransferase [Acidimicrobiales bacterium]